VKKFRTLENIQNATKEELIGVEDIADIVAESIYTYFKNNKNFIENMKITLTLDERKQETGKNMLEGKSFCITGSLSRVRKEYEDLIEQNGGKNVSGVTNKTNYLVTNDQTTPTSKLTKAKELGTIIIDELQLQTMLGLN
jgi:DNA ligase (NAD+)